MPRMRAKFQVTGVTKSGDTMVELKMMAVTDKDFNPDGESDDNDFARWTPSGEVTMVITNPNLLNTFKAGQKFYLDFTEAA